MKVSLKGGEVGENLIAIGQNQVMKQVNGIFCDTIVLTVGTSYYKQPGHNGGPCFSSDIYRHLRATNITLQLH